MKLPHWLEQFAKMVLISMSHWETVKETVAGHVFGDLIVQTTAEVILGEVCGMQFRREFDKATGYSELVISKCEEMK